MTIKDIPAEEYHASDGVSNSMVTDFLLDPAWYAGRHILGIYPGAKSDAMGLGTICHALMEGQKLEDVAAVYGPDVLSKNGRRTGKEWNAFCEENKGKILIPAESTPSIKGADELENILSRIHDHAEAKYMLSAPGRREISVWWQDDGLKRKSRIDKLGDGFILDLKFVDDPSPRKFSFAARDRGYYRQAAYYTDAALAIDNCWRPMFFICVQTRPPYDVRVYEFSKELLLQGKEEIRFALEGIKRCMKANCWQRETWGQLEMIS